jgi:cell division protein FtsL
MKHRSTPSRLSLNPLRKLLIVLLILASCAVVTITTVHVRRNRTTEQTHAKPTAR